MREILFRGKRTDTGEWVYGDLIHRRIWGSDLCIIRSSDYGFDNYVECEVIPETVGQFTGKMDKNGTKIFEYDICNVNESVYEVVFKYSTWTFEKISKEVWNCPNFYSHCDDDCEIIGNVFNNPEFLEGILK